VQLPTLSTNAMQDAQHDGWLTIVEAASHLGCSVDTIRPRIRRGELSAQQVHTPTGPPGASC
jgi:DNA-directed RNA polymerase specialized sigma24 family protein